MNRYRIKTPEEYQMEAERAALDGLLRLKTQGVKPQPYGPMPQAMDELGPPGDSGALRGTAGMGGWALAQARIRRQLLQDLLSRIA